MNRVSPYASPCVYRDVASYSPEAGTLAQPPAVPEWGMTDIRPVTTCELPTPEPVLPVTPGRHRSWLF